MRLEFSRSAATASLTASLTARLLYGMTLDAPEAANAAWLSTLAGLLLSLPLTWLLCGVRGAGRRVLAGALFVGIALDAAASVEWTAYSESCLAFDHVSPTLMALPLMLAVARCAWLGGDALGGAARVWMRLFAALIFVVILYQLPYYNPLWLAPWLGSGARAVLQSGRRAAGWNALICASAVLACDDALRFRDVLPCLLLSTAAAAALVALRQMMAPVPTASAVARSARIDALLTNGRAPLYLQLPMIVAWFVGMLHLMAFEALAACALIHRLLPKAGAPACAAVGLGAVALLVFAHIPRAALTQRALSCLYPALFIVGIPLRLTDGRSVKKCAGSL